MDDLFALLDGHVDFAPPASPAVEGPPTEEYEIDGKRYLIERHNDKDGDFWRLFIRTGSGWSRLYLCSDDAASIPAELLDAAESMLDWAAGESQRRRDLVAVLRPLRIEDMDEPGDAFEG